MNKETYNGHFNKDEKFNWTHLRHIRTSRRLSQQAFSEKCGLNRVTLAKLETNELEMSPLYYDRINKGLQRIRFSRLEMEAIKTMQRIRQSRGYSK